MVDATGFEPASIRQLGHYPKPSLPLETRASGDPSSEPQPASSTLPANLFQPEGLICLICFYAACPTFKNIFGSDAPFCVSAPVRGGAAATRGEEISPMLYQLSYFASVSAKAGIEPATLGLINVISSAFAYCTVKRCGRPSENTSTT